MNDRFLINRTSEVLCIESVLTMWSFETPCQQIYSVFQKLFSKMHSTLIGAFYFIGMKILHLQTICHLLLIHFELIFALFFNVVKLNTPNILTTICCQVRAFEMYSFHSTENLVTILKYFGSHSDHIDSKIKENHFMRDSWKLYHSNYMI